MADISKEERIKALQQKIKNRFLPISIGPSGPTFKNISYEQEQQNLKQKIEEQKKKQAVEKLSGIEGLPEDVKNILIQTGDVEAAKNAMGFKKSDIDLKKAEADTPKAKASLLANLLLPAMKKFSTEYPGKMPGLSYLRGKWLEEGEPYGFFPEYTNYQNVLMGMKPIIAKGLLSQTGQLTEIEQKDPLKMFPSPYDTEQTRKASENRILDLLNMLTGKDYKKSYETGNFEKPGVSQEDLMKQLEEINKALAE